MYAALPTDNHGLKAQLSGAWQALHINCTGAPTPAHGLAQRCRSSTASRRSVAKLLCAGNARQTRKLIRLMRTFDNELRKCLQRIASSGDVAILQVWLQKFLLAGFLLTQHPPWNGTLRVTYFPQNTLQRLSAARPRSLRLRAASTSENQK